MRSAERDMKSADQMGRCSIATAEGYSAFKSSSLRFLDTICTGSPELSTCEEIFAFCMFHKASFLRLSIIPICLPFAWPFVAVSVSVCIATPGLRGFANGKGGVLSKRNPDKVAQKMNSEIDCSCVLP